MYIPPLDHLEKAYEELVDKKYTEGLTIHEAKVMEAIGVLIDDYEDMKRYRIKAQGIVNGP